MVTERIDPGRSLTRTELLSLAEAAHENAVDLAAEARQLLDTGRHARAYVLAEAAVEELGKLILVARVRVELAMGGSRVDWTRFWNRFIDHADKAWNAGFLDQLLSEQPEAWARGDVDAIRKDTGGTAKAKREAAYMVELRERALHVGFRDGKVECPSEQIPPADAPMIVDAVQQLSTMLAGLVAGEDRLKLIGRDPELRKHAYELRRRLNRIRPGPPPA